MQLHELLKQLKKIEPDPDYTRKSRLLILGNEPLPGRSPFMRFLVHNLQFGAAVAVMAVVLFLIFGGSPLFNAITPFKGSALDPTSLKAEAQDIDIQVQLAKLSYQETNASAALTPQAIKKISEVVTQNSKDLNSLKQLNAQIAASAPAVTSSATSTATSTVNATGTAQTVTGTAPNASDTATSTDTNSAPTLMAPVPAPQTTSSNLTPDQVLEQLSQ